MAQRTNRTRCVLSITLAAGVLAASCSSASKSADTTTPGTVELVTPTTAAPASTTSTTPETTVAATTTTTVPGPPTYRLTGLPITDLLAAGHPAMVVKIDNNPLARPQTGLNEADIVYEENVEQLTRFAAVFQSTSSEPVGPIRSGRTQDVALLGSLNKPLFVWSGGNARVTAAINASDLVPINETKASKAMFRSNTRPAPHNLYGNMALLYDFAPPDASPPPAQFQYRPEGATSTAATADGVKVSMDNVRVLWKWDPKTSTYLRWSDDKVHKDALNDTQVSTNNVVVLFVDYIPSPADGRSPEAQTIGTGDVWVFTDGTILTGTWTRTDRLQPFTLTSTDGTPMLLTPGRTFVELSRTGKGAILGTGVDPAVIPYP